MNLSQVTIPPEYYARLRTGVRALDEVFGGSATPGLHPYSMVALSGMPGSGKSTLFLQLADMLTARGYKVLYCAGEEGLEPVKMRADRLKLKAEFAVTKTCELTDLLRELADSTAKVLFVDSLQKVTRGKLSGGKRLLAVAKRLYEYVNEERVAIVLSAQVTKSGVIAGPQEMAHEFDAHLHLDVSPDREDMRTLTAKKNRFGPTNQPIALRMLPNLGLCATKECRK